MPAGCLLLRAACCSKLPAPVPTQCSLVACTDEHASQCHPHPALAYCLECNARAELFADWLATRVGRPCSSLLLRMLLTVPYLADISSSLRCVYRMASIG